MKRIRNLSPTAILVVGAALFLVYAFPGQMTQDSIDQLTEARSGYFTDAHPPAMEALWRILDAIVAGPFGMLLVQTSTFLVGCFLVLRRALRPRAAALAASAVLLFPPVATTMAVIWKDPLMAGFLVLGTGLVLEQNRKLKLAGLLALGVASAVRYNAFAATLPVIVLLFEWTPAGAWKRYAIATCAWLGVTLAAMSVNVALTDQPMHFWTSSLAVIDVTGTLSYEDDVSDEEILRELADTGLLVDHDIQAHARKIYDTRDFVTLVIGPDKLWDLPITGTVPAPERQRDAIAAAWWRAITEHPGAYLHHRWRCFLDVLGVTYRPIGAVPPRVLKYPGMLENLGLGTGWSRVQNRWLRVHRWLWAHTPLFRQWMWAVIALVLLVLARGHRDVLAVLASGLVMEMSLLALAPSPDYRYSHWMIAGTCLAIVMLTARRAGVGAPDSAGTRAASPRDARARPDPG